MLILNHVLDCVHTHRTIRGGWQVVVLSLWKNGSNIQLVLGKDIEECLVFVDCHTPSTEKLWQLVTALKEQ
jgi:hypothetical protein